MTQRTKTVKGVALLGRLSDGSAQYLANVQTHSGEYGNFHRRAQCVAEVMREKMKTERVVDCTIIFQPPNRRTNTKGKK